MSLPKTIWYCPIHKTTHLEQQCPKDVELRVAGPDDLLIRREVVEAWLRMANNSEIFDLEYHLEQALAAAEGESKWGA